MVFLETTCSTVVSSFSARFERGLRIARLAGVSFDI